MRDIIATFFLFIATLVFCLLVATVCQSYSDAITINEGFKRIGILGLVFVICFAIIIICAKGDKRDD